jgi:YD repeat-containing protein
VVVGGPPTISMMGLAMKGAFAALGKFAKSGLFKRVRQQLFGHLKPSFLKCAILRAEPVNIVTGEVEVEQVDFTLPGRIPINWVRSYASSNRRVGACGHGWETPADGRLEIDAANDVVLMQYPAVGPLCFARLPLRPGEDGAELELMDGARLTDHGDEYQVRTKADRVYHFRKGHGAAREDGVYEIPLARISDLCGNWLEFERRDRRAIAISESAGRRVHLRRDRGRIVDISLTVLATDAAHRFVSYEYDAGGDLTTVVDALGKPCLRAVEHHLVRHTNRNGLSFFYK